MPSLSRCMQVDVVARDASGIGHLHLGRADVPGTTGQWDVVQDASQQTSASQDQPRCCVVWGCHLGFAPQHQTVCISQPSPTAACVSKSLFTVFTVLDVAGNEPSVRPQPTRNSPAEEAHISPSLTALAR
jgi:hypothetical protein